MSTQNMEKNLINNKKIKNQKYKNKNKMCRRGTNLHYLFCLISNTLPQLEQSSLHPQQFSVIASCYRPPATTISVFSYTSTAPEKENRSRKGLRPFNPLQKSPPKVIGPCLIRLALPILLNLVIVSFLQTKSSQPVSKKMFNC